MASATGSGTADDPWVLKTPPGTSEYRCTATTAADPPELVCQVGSTKLRYLARCLDDVPAMLRGARRLDGPRQRRREQAGQGRHPRGLGPRRDNPVGGWYGLRKGYRGRFAMYVPPLLEHLGLVELEHNPRNNRVHVAS